MAGVDEGRRLRIGGGLLLLGVLLVLLGVLLVVSYHPPANPASIPKVADTPRLLQSMLYVLVLLVLVFAVSVIAFLRWSRHFRQLILRRKAPPTPAEDVWAMHRLPEEPTGTEDEGETGPVSP